MSHALEFPEPIRVNGQLRFVERDIENHVRALAGLPLLPNDPTAPVRLLKAADVTARYGFGRRTLGRRIRKPEAA